MGITPWEKAKLSEFGKNRFAMEKTCGWMGVDGNGWEPCGRRGQQHCCWESLRDNSLVNLKVQPSQTELLFRSVDNSFFAMRMGGMGRDGSYGNGWEPCGRRGAMRTEGSYGMGKAWRCRIGRLSKCNRFCMVPHGGEVQVVKTNGFFRIGRCGDE